MFQFCTLFDHHYLLRGLALHRSLEQVCQNYRLYILCLSNECFHILNRKALNNVKLIKLTELEADDTDLPLIKGNRSLIEYYFSIKPFLPIYIFHKFSDVDLLTYIDSDIFFYDDPAPIFREIRDSSVAITAHHFSDKLKQWGKYGKYNTGWMSFRNDKNGLACLNWFRDRCIEWCYDRFEATRYADQKYLDYFASKFNDVREITHLGANVAPWNVGNYSLRQVDNKVYVEGYPLIFYHFHRFKNVLGKLYDSGLANFNCEATSLIRGAIYQPYLSCLKCLEAELEHKSNQMIFNGIREKYNNSMIQGSGLFDIFRRIRRSLIIIRKNSYIYHK